jgi:glycine C-acetyltransferase
MNARLEQQLTAELDALKAAGTYKTFNTLASPMDAVVQMEGRGEVIVLSSNNYLGLANHPEVVRAGVEGLNRYGAGTASVRFICGTFTAHRELEAAIASFVGTEAALTYVSCWNANEALIPTLTDASTVIFSDALNHASIIDAMRLARPARKVIYKHADMADLRAGLEACEAGQRKLIVTDGVFSMEGDLAPLPDIVELARAHDAVVIVDDSHGTGVMGKTGRGVAEHFGLLGEVDILTSTLGKALGGAAGGFVAGSAALCDVLAQRSRPQLFSNALPPTVACSARRAIEIVQAEPGRVEQLRANTRYFRERLLELGYRPLEGAEGTPGRVLDDASSRVVQRPGRSEAAIIPILVGDTAFAIRISRRLLEEGVFVTGFGYPVVAEGAARVRVQISAALTRDHLDRALDAFARVGREVGLL